MILRSKSLWLFLAAYGASVVVLVLAGRELEETLAILVLFGIAFPLLGLATCIKAPQPTAPAPPRPGEAALLAGLLVYVALFLAAKGPILGVLEPEGTGARLHSVINTLLKLVALVAIPVGIYYARYRALPDVGRRTMSAGRLWLSFALVGIVVFGVTLMISGGSKDLLAGRYGAAQSVGGVVLCFAWMAVEAGFVEEVLFRWLLQSRIAALTGSQLSAVCLCALLFGLGHAPGMWLRGAGVEEGLGETPNLATVIAYAITTQGIASLFVATLWARARSLLLVIGLHTLVDAASNSGRFIETWLTG